jgi:hypothetical protein
MFKEIIRPPVVNGIVGAMMELGSGLPEGLSVLSLNGDNALCTPVGVRLLAEDGWVETDEVIPTADDIPAGNSWLGKRKDVIFPIPLLRRAGRVGQVSQLTYMQRGPRWGTHRGPDFEKASVYTLAGEELTGPYFGASKVLDPSARFVRVGVGVTQLY